MEKVSPVTAEEWASVNEWNRFIFDDFLANSTELSPKTLKNYASNLKIWFRWVMENLDNKQLTEIKPREYLRFQNWLVNRGCSSSDISIKRSSISSLNSYVEIYWGDEFPTFHNFINKSIKRPPPAFVHEKEPLTKAEFEHLIDVLTEREEWQKIAYLKFTFETGCRRAESRQVMKDIVNAEPSTREKIICDEFGNQVVQCVTLYQTPPIRCKGAGKTGKVRKLTFSEDTMDAFKKWLDARGEDDCPYMFINKRNGVVSQIGENGFNSWATSDFAKIVGRRFHPHLLRESRATQAVVEENKDIEQVRALLGHNSSETTKIYVIRDDTEDVTDLF